MGSAWNWAALAGLGAYHGLNPAMGWLFAAALGLHRGSARVVGLSLLPLAAGHAAATALTAGLVLALGVMLDGSGLRWAVGIVLLAWAAWMAVRGHRPPLHIGMQAGLAALALWSFMMAAGHGAGLMLLPALLPLCRPDGSASTGIAWTGAAAGLAVHSAAAIATTAAMAFAVYGWIGVGFLRRGWINLDRIWIAALAISGAALLVLA